MTGRQGAGTFGPRGIAVAMSLVVVAIAALVLVGWWTGERRLMVFFTGNAAMKANQALCLLLLATALAAFALGNRSKPLVALSRACAAAALSIAALTVAEHLGLALPLPLDTLLAPDTAAPAGSFPGRMSPGSAVALLLLAASLLCVPGTAKAPRPARIAASQALAVAGLLAGLLRLVSFAYGLSPFARIGGWGLMGTHSAASLVLIGAGVVLLHPAHGLAALFASERAGSVLARRLCLPLIGLGVVLGGALEWSDFAGRYGAPVTLAVLNLGFAIVLVAAIGWAARALNLASARVRLQRQLYAVLSSINTAIVRIRDREALMQEACRLLVESGGFRGASIGLLGQSGNGLFGASAGTAPLRDLQPLFSPATDSSLHPLPASIVSRTGLTWSGVAASGSALTVVPLRTGGRAVGVLAVESSSAKRPGEDVRRLLAQIGDDLGFGVDYLDKEARLAFLAYHDALTGLPNGTRFMERATQALSGPRQPGRHIAVVVLDIDRFSQINDTLGRACGDALLQITARRLQRCIRSGEIVARLSADSFALLLLGDAADLVEHVSGRVLQGLQEPYIVGRQIRLSARCGIAVAPRDGEDAATLFANAEAALKDAQQARAPWRLYSANINSSAAERLSMETRLRNAIDRREFRLHFQPKFFAGTRRISGVEGLLRWQDAEGRLVPPAGFIPVLEDTGLIVPVGSQVVELALEARRRWQEAGAQAPRVAINVSGAQLRRGDFVARLRESLAAADEDGSALEVEITESVLVKDDHDATIRTLQELRAMGVSIAVDDFGTGYSSLQYLSELPVDTLKIDRSFVSTLSDRSQSAAIVATIISLAHTLRLTVVAEGVETQAQALALQALGCDELQGYLLGRPQPELAIVPLLEAVTPQATPLAAGQ